MSAEPRIRREIRPGDFDDIVALHRLYAREYGLDGSFAAMVAEGLAEAASRGWPGPREAGWLVERGGELVGSLGLTDEGDGGARLRWFLFDQSLRGQGLGRRLLDEFMARVTELGYDRVTLETFSELEAAAHLYRSRGFAVVWAETGPRWGRPEITYQRYELRLADKVPRPWRASANTTSSSSAPPASPAA
jgi:ribosomal protein S18 acetylase RimI-like enzyme